MKICVIDGMGGGIGNALIKKTKAAFHEQVEVIALGTNAIATAQMPEPTKAPVAKMLLWSPCLG